MESDYIVPFDRVLDRCKILTWDRDGLVLVYSVWSKAASSAVLPGEIIEAQRTAQQAYDQAKLAELKLYF